MQLLAFEQSLTDPTAEGRVRQVVKDEDRLIEAPQLTHGPIKMVARATGQQAFEGHRRGGLACGKGGEELAHAVPMGGDPVEMNGPLWWADKRGEGAIPNRATTSFTLVGHSADFTLSVPTRRA